MKIYFISSMVALSCFALFFIWIALPGCYSNLTGNKTQAISKNELLAITQQLITKPNRVDKFSKLFNVIQNSMPYPNLPLRREPKSPPITPTNEAVIAAALSLTYIPRDVTTFAGTLRKTGFNGDIVLLVLQNTAKPVIERALKYNVTVFYIDNNKMSCQGKFNVKCTYPNYYTQNEIPVTILRYYLYQDILLRYVQSSQILITDFRDVLFQTNPFKNKIVLDQKNSPAKSMHIFMFSEAYPNRVIRRCPITASHVMNCYGLQVLQQVSSDVISTSSMVFGKRNVLLAYSFLMTTQADPRLRLNYNDSIAPTALSGESLVQQQEKCMTFGADMAFHNILLHNNIFSKYMHVRMFPQGEGIVNVLGGYHGENKLLQAELSEWKILRGESPFKYIYNWNGEISPVVHQLDRYLTTELNGGYHMHLAVCQHLYF